MKNSTTQLDDSSANSLTSTSLEAPTTSIQEQSESAPPTSESACDPACYRIEALVKELKESGAWQPLLEYIRDTGCIEKASAREVVETITNLLLTHKPQLTIDALMYVAGFDTFSGYSLRHFAARNGMSHQGFSNFVDYTRRLLSLSQS
jgi:hypothetical protein